MCYGSLVCLMCYGSNLSFGFLVSFSGTGVVTSVPSDSPDDFAALRDLKKKEVSERASSCGMCYLSV